ncbi:hypothetical protein AVEN_99918-1 [Araneus ventricosus]|uniref:Uncharacterized protein n=1 Tax=Araneus ventricosus TaxID=182803 RepID=A0A4Y2J296_ARAVE|nr:hypothetical protein AVEN_99918-1 [Araneus ventricosus]
MLVDEFLEATVPIRFRLPRCSKMLARYMNPVDIPESVPRGPALHGLHRHFSVFYCIKKRFANVGEEREGSKSISDGRVLKTVKCTRDV